MIMKIYKKLVIYGAGSNGKKIYHFFKARKMEDKIECFCDKNWKYIREIDEIPVKSYDDLKNDAYIFIISVDGEGQNEVKKLLEADNKEYYISFSEWIDNNFKDKSEKERNLIAYAHIDNPYFEEVDNTSNLDVFWNQESDFYKMFQIMDLENVIELACGKGRHVPKYINDAGHITLVDILNSNLLVCRNRFGDIEKISYYCNSGSDLSELESNKYSALFTYDAMVHFEMLDIYNYLKETYRVLRKNGMALFHHSNLHDDYKTSFTSNVHCRNFMSKNLFAHIAWKCGFEIVNQKIISWESDNKPKILGLDCITLVRKG